METFCKVTTSDQQALEGADREDGPMKTTRIKSWKLNQLGLSFFLHQKLKLLCNANMRFGDE